MLFNVSVTYDGHVKVYDAFSDLVTFGNFDNYISQYWARQPKDSYFQYQLNKERLRCVSRQRELRLSFLEEILTSTYPG